MERKQKPVRVGEVEREETTSLLVGGERKRLRCTKNESALKDKETTIHCSTSPQSNNTAWTMQQKNILEAYTFHNEIGKGSFGLVRLCRRDDTGDFMACKSIRKGRTRNFPRVSDLEIEIHALRQLRDHTCVVQLYEVFEDSEFVHLVMQYCEGNDLFSRVTERKFFTEPEAAVICQKVASVLDFAHSKGIMHRDIKLENILMVSNAIDTDIRVADFGSAALFCAEEKLSKFIGSPYYVSPSVIKGSYGSEADLWSLGVVLYILLSGVPPFFGKSRAETIGAVLNNPLNLRAGKLASVSADAKDLLTNLLSRNTQEIISASQVLQHPWIQKHTYGDPYIFDKRTPTSFSFFGGKPTCSVDVASAYKENFLPSCGHTGEEGSTAGRGILQLSKAQSGWDQAEEHVTTIYKDCASCSLP